MTELISWMKEYSPPIVLALAGLAAIIFVLQKVVEKAIETSFEQKKKDFELFLERRSTFWEKVLAERYTLVTGLLTRLEKIATNLNRIRTNHPVPSGFKQGNEIVPLTEVFEDIEIHRLLLSDHYHDLFYSLARLTLDIANATDNAAWAELGAKRSELHKRVRHAADQDFHISQISFESPISVRHSLLADPHLKEQGMTKTIHVLPDDQKEQIEYERALLFHVNNILHTRVNFVLVAQSLVLAAVAQVWQGNGMSVKVILCGLGIVLTILLWYPLATLNKRGEYLTRHLLPIDPLYRGYLAAWRLRPLTASDTLVHLISLAFFVAWFLLLVVAVKYHCFFPGQEQGAC